MFAEFGVNAELSHPVACGSLPSPTAIAWLPIDATATKATPNDSAQPAIRVERIHRANIETICIPPECLLCYPPGVCSVAGAHYQRLDSVYLNGSELRRARPIEE